MSSPTDPPQDESQRDPRIRARVALTLLETIRTQDLPTEVLEEENPSHTIPRRLGLSEVIDRQIRRYREEARKRRRIRDEEVRDLMRLVIRRPDSEEVFFEVGRRLAGEGKSRGWLRFLPDRLAFAMARRKARRAFRRLFGRGVGGFGDGAFVLEGRAHLFIQSDPGGDACALVSGFCERILRGTVGEGASVTHSACEARGDALCRWVGEREG